MTKKHGKNAAIYFNGVKVTVKTEWALAINWQYADVSTFRDKNVVYASGLADISGTFAGFLDIDGDAVIAQAKEHTTPVTVAIYPEDGGSAICSGPAWIDAQVTASITDAVRCSGSWKAAGDWTF